MRLAPASLLAVASLTAPLGAQAPAAEAPSVSASDMSLTTADGFVLKGTLSLPGTRGKGKHGRRVPVVILAHQFNSNQAGWGDLPGQLHALGIGTLNLDLRGHGASTHKGDGTSAVTSDFFASAKAVGFDQIPSDLVQVATWLRKQKGVDGRRLGMAGSSVGGFSVILASAKVHPVAVLALSPAGSPVFGEHSRDDLAAAQRRGRAALFVMTAKDDQDAAENGKVLQGIPGALVDTVEGNAHGFAFLKDRGHVMAKFFNQYLVHFHSGAEPAAKPKADAKPAGMPGVSVAGSQTVPPPGPASNGPKDPPAPAPAH